MRYISSRLRHIWPTYTVFSMLLHQPRGIMISVGILLKQDRSTHTRTHLHQYMFSSFRTHAHARSHTVIADERISVTPINRVTIPRAHTNKHTRTHVIITSKHN